MFVEYEEPVEESNDNDREDPHFSDIILLIGIILLPLSIILLIVGSNINSVIIAKLASFGLLIGAWGIAFRILMHILYIIPNVVVRTIVDLVITLPLLFILLFGLGFI